VKELKEHGINLVAPNFAQDTLEEVHPIFR